MLALYAQWTPKPVDPPVPPTPEPTPAEDATATSTTSTGSTGDMTPFAIVTILGFGLCASAVAYRSRKFITGPYKAK